MQASDIIPFHPYSNKFPFLNGAEFNSVVDDIGANGLHEPITLYQGKILDGRNRYRACIGAKVKPRFEQFEGDDAAARAFVIMATTKAMKINRPIFILRLRPEPGVDPIHALRRALKSLLRQHGMKALSVDEEQQTNKENP